MSAKRNGKRGPPKGKREQKKKPTAGKRERRGETRVTSNRGAGCDDG